MPVNLWVSFCLPACLAAPPGSAPTATPYLYVFCLSWATMQVGFFLST